MLNQIRGLHHVTSLARDAAENNRFFTNTLGLRRIKKTVNFDAPDVYHLYYGDKFGTPGSVMTYFPFPHAARGSPPPARSPSAHLPSRGDPSALERRVVKKRLDIPESFA